MVYGLCIYMQSILTVGLTSEILFAFFFDGRKEESEFRILSMAKNMEYKKEKEKEGALLD